MVLPEYIWTVRRSLSGFRSLSLQNGTDYKWLTARNVQTARFEVNPASQRKRICLSAVP